MRAAMLNGSSIVINVIIVNDINFLPNLVLLEDDAGIGDYWNGSDFIKINNPLHPNYKPPTP